MTSDVSQTMYICIHTYKKLQTELSSDQNFFKQIYLTKHFIEQLTQAFKFKNIL